MAKKKEESLNASIATAINTKFDLEKFKKGKNLNTSSIKFKETRWLPLSKAFQDVLQVPGFALGHINLLRGHSDTGKTTAMLEGAVSAQKMGILPVFIITEMKWSWDHARQMGLQINEVVDESTGEVTDYNGFFLYADREKLACIEDVAAFISDLLDEQKNGKLPFDLIFFWDSIGSIPCRLSIESNKNNNEWNAGAMSTQFGNFINQRIVMSRKESQPYTNTLVAVNKVWVAKPATVMSQPTLQNKGGNTMYFDSSLVFTFGNIASAGTNKIKAQTKGKDMEFAKRTKISCDKNHVTGVTGAGRIIMTVHGFIDDSPTAVNNYKKQHQEEWLAVLGSSNFDIVEEEDTTANADMFESPDDV